MALNGQTTDAATGRALDTPDPLVTVYGSARVDYYAANRSIVTLEAGAAQEEHPVFTIGSGRNQARRLVRPWARLAWDAGGSGVSAWYSGFSLPEMVRLASGEPVYTAEAAFHLEGRTSQSFAREAGRLVVGASVQDNEVNSKGTILGLAYDDRSDQYYGAFAQLEYRVGLVRVIGAVRWDDANLYAPQLSPKAAFVFTPTKNHALRVSVNRAFLTPSLPTLFAASAAGTGVQNLSAIEAQLRADPSVGPALAAVPNGTLFTNSAAVPESSLGNPVLAPQTVTSYEAGYKGQIGWRAFITLDAYAARIENFTTSMLPGVNPMYPRWTAPPEVPAADRATVESAVRNALAPRGSAVQNGLTRLPDATTAVVLSFANVGTVDEWGVEFGSSISLSRVLTTSASYAWYNSAIRDNVAGNVLSPNTPRNKGVISLTYAGRQGIDVGVDARIVSGYHWTMGLWDGDIPASQMVNLSAGYRINPHLRVFANATNLFDQQHFEVYGGSVIGRRVLAALTSTF